MGIVNGAQLRCRVTVSHNHPVNFVNEMHKMLDNFVISNPLCLMFSDQMQHFIISVSEKIGVQHVQREQYRCFNIKLVWSKIVEFSNFDDGILEPEGTVCYPQSNNPQI